MTSSDSLQLERSNTLASLGRSLINTHKARFIHISIVTRESVSFQITLYTHSISQLNICFGHLSLKSPRHLLTVLITFHLQLPELYEEKYKSPDRIPNFHPDAGTHSFICLVS